jgi:hypothetical protein
VRAVDGKIEPGIAMQQNDDTGSPVTSGEHLTDEQYLEQT